MEANLNVHHATSKLAKAILNKKKQFYYILFHFLLFLIVNLFMIIWFDLMHRDEVDKIK
jgi:hypothetical protein